LFPYLHWMFWQEYPASIRLTSATAATNYRDQSGLYQFSVGAPKVTDVHTGFPSDGFIFEYGFTVVICVARKGQKDVKMRTRHEPYPAVGH
jgi:hypothetical protein